MGMGMVLFFAAQESRAGAEFPDPVRGILNRQLTDRPLPLLGGLRETFRLLAFLGPFGRAGGPRIPGQGLVRTPTEFCIFLASLGS